MFEHIIEAIQEYSRIIIHRHSRPDGDALGSQIGLAELIRATYPDKTVYTVGDSAGRYAFMDGAEMDEIPDKAYEGALAVILDSAEESLVSDSRYTLASKTVRIDHHIWCATFTDLEVVDTSFESCAGMIAAFARESGLTLSKKSATAIFTGMVTDSGRFRYDSTSARTFELAAFLMSAGIDTEKLYRRLYSGTLDDAKLKAAFIERIRIFENSSVAFIYTTASEIAETGRDAFTISRGMVNLMSDITGIDIWVNFTEIDGSVMCELRSSKYNINPVAVRYGGGGHKKASGADVRDYDEAMKMLADLKALTEACGESDE